ncbi:MAG: pyridoxamine 5-phosphate oxidase, partial [Ilumatobacteraceae bacterium]|nr:pyridoxamine 5-phosphate oxidase [Ilumatobacteraceae bacterium]
FDALRQLAPTLARPIGERFLATGLGMLGTVRLDGSARVSPIEVTIQDGHLYVGSMPGARKAQDLARDARCCLVTPLADKHDTSGEGKLFCLARFVDDEEEAARVLGNALAADVDLDAFAGSPCFELQIVGAAWQYVEGETFRTISWSAATGLRRRERVGPSGAVQDVAVDDTSGAPGGVAPVV